MSCDRGKNIPAVENCRDLRKPVLAAGQVYPFDRLSLRLCLLQHQAEQAVIRADKVLVAQSPRQRATTGAHPRINHRYMNRPRREIRHSTPQRQGALKDVLRL